MPTIKRRRTLLGRVRERLAGTRSDTTGAALVEYALLAAAVVTLVVSVTLLFGPAVRGLFEQIAEELVAQVDGAGSGGQGGGNDGGNGNGGNGNGGNGNGNGGNGNGKGNGK